MKEITKEEKDKILPILKTKEGREHLIKRDKTGFGELMRNDTFYVLFLRNLFNDHDITLDKLKFIEKKKK